MRIEPESIGLPWPMSGQQWTQLERYGDWLETEAVPAGGLGPNEVDRIQPRHLLDSIFFAHGWSHVEPPALVADLGSGVGLPGIPLAILWPAAKVHLVDRAGRRVDLAKRAIRILGLDNVTTHQVDAATYVGSQGDSMWGADTLLVARGAGDPGRVRAWTAPAVRAGATLVTGGSTLQRPTDVDPMERIVEVGAEILDRPSWLRIIGP